MWAEITRIAEHARNRGRLDRFGVTGGRLRGDPRTDRFQILRALRVLQKHEKPYSLVSSLSRNFETTKDDEEGSRKGKDL